MVTNPELCLSLEECYETIIQTMAEGVFVVDFSGRLIFANNAMQHFTGYPADELIGRSCHDFMECRCDSENDCAMGSAASLVQKECFVKHRDGRKIPVLRNAKPKHDRAGQVRGIIETITDLTELKKVKRHLEVLEQRDRERVRFHRMIGKSPAMQDVFNLIRLAGASNASILVTGESGTGKELVAEMIHNESRRKKKMLIKVNCSALSENLLESELFGHVKGAFTGAIKDKKGRFEAAHSGSLFLDEISDISPLIQLKLLRFLQEKEFERVGENRTRKADVRIISATNKDLRVLIHEGLFREDLYYRLKVFPIHLPALRERKEDIPLLLEHFVNKFNLETGKQLKGLTGQASALLLDYSWPGNVRELENAVEHAFVVRSEGFIDKEDLPLEIRDPGVLQPSPDIWKNGSISADSLLPAAESKNKPVVTLEELTALLDRFHWNKAAVARYLNINRTTVWRMMKRLGMH